jgi:hypothetical protein
MRTRDAARDAIFYHMRIEACGDEWRTVECGVCFACIGGTNQAVRARSRAIAMDMSDGSTFYQHEHNQTM